ERGLPEAYVRRLRPGGVVRAMLQEVGIDLRLQVVAITWPLADDARPTFTVSTNLPGLTTRLARMLSGRTSGTVSVSGSSGSSSGGYSASTIDALLAQKADLVHASRHQHGGADEVAVE